MNNETQNLWRKIAEFPLDSPGDPLPFSRRLARENNWTPTYTRRVLEEYRRFLFLAVQAGHPVSPSEAVDEVWHFHLLYTESYWVQLCQNTLGTALHHHPTRGGAQESAKFQDWYARTLNSYERCFGATPPGDIWPVPGSSGAGIVHSRQPAWSRPPIPIAWLHYSPLLLAGIVVLFAFMDMSGTLAEPLRISLIFFSLMGAAAAGLIRLAQTPQVMGSTDRRRSAANNSSSSCSSGSILGGDSSSCGEGRDGGSDGGGADGGGGGGDGGGDGGGCSSGCGSGCGGGCGS